jgi:hypothetical protein
MTDTTLDAALQAADTALGFEGHEITDVHRTYARALIAKLIEGMGPPSLLAEHNSSMASGIDLALTEIRRRAGIEGEK